MLLCLYYVENKLQKAKELSVANSKKFLMFWREELFLALVV